MSKALISFIDHLAINHKCYLVQIMVKMNCETTYPLSEINIKVSL